MSWTPADDYDDQGRHRPGPYPPRTRPARCAERCCTGTPLCHAPEEGNNDKLTYLDQEPHHDPR